MIDVAIVDDHPIALRGLEAILRSQTGLRVCASAGVAAELSRVATVDVAVVGLYLCGDGPALTDITAISVRCPVLVMSASGRPADVLAAIRAGARGYLTKQATEQGFTSATKAVAEGGFYLSASLAHIVQRDLSLPDRPARPALTTREEQALSYIARGLTHAQTASRMGISETTVNTHIERIRRKLGLGNKAELTRMAITLEQQRLQAGVSRTASLDGS
ncbi:MAG: response regulator transcription factor [Streptosporangiaceae bacterium]|nr:response regulator transcription factor [Streptosporangiaceae bacterium]